MLEIKVLLIGHLLGRVLWVLVSKSVFVENEISYHAPPASVTAAPNSNLHQSFCATGLASNECVMIEITTRLTRGAVYFAGEQLECWITLRNVSHLSATPEGKAASEKDPRAKGVTEGSTAIAFVSGQIHCQCSVEESKVSVSARPPLIDGAESAGRKMSTAGLADQNSFCVVSTIPKLLVGNLNLLPGEEFNVLYSEVVPKASCPSFRGLMVRYAWKLAFGCQVLGRDTTVIHIPLFIMIIKDVDSLLAMNEEIKLSDAADEVVGHNGDGIELPPLNGFSPKENGIHSVTPTQVLSVEAAMEVLDGLTSRRTLRTYNIEAANGKVGRLCLNKTQFRLGEDITGKFDFTDRNVTCVQYLVSLIGEEHVSEENKKTKNMAPSENIVSKVHDFCLCLEQTSFVLPVPLHITPTFQSDIVELKWKLRMEFALSPEILQMDVPPVGHDQQSVLWRPPLRVPVETLVWDVPVELFPTDPIQVHSVHLRDSLGADVRVKL